jgi:predicted nucleotidyltransferase component of viral defense system
VSFSSREIQEHAATTGFRPDSLEKSFRLLSLLEALRSHPFLRPRIALKGGTALNLFLFDVPRLSVDIDLNYVGSADRSVMLADRPKLDHAIQAVCARERLSLKRIPSEHAGGKWRLSFTNAAGSSSKLEVDLNFMFRIPLWPVITLDSRPLGPVVARQIPVLDWHELAAGKLAALCSRNASRDLFDAREILRRPSLDRGKLRLAFVVYGALNRKDWRTVRASDIAAEPAKLKHELLPLLRAEFRPARGALATWSEALVEETRERMSVVLPLARQEREFIGRLNDAGDIAPELLARDASMQAAIREHPGIKWKALSVQQRARGGGDFEPVV